MGGIRLMWTCFFAAFVLLIAAFMAPRSVGNVMVIAAVLVFITGLIVGVRQRERATDRAVPERDVDGG